MSESIIRDNYFLLYSLILGVLVTVLYDVLRIFRRLVRHTNALISMEDLFYWLVVAISVFIMMHEENNGTLRWFAILGACIGMFLYKKLLSSLFVDTISRMLGFVFHYLGIPLRVVTKSAQKGVKAVSYRGSKGLRRIKKKLTEWLKTLKMILCKQ